MLNWKGFVALTGRFQLESENQLEFNVVNNITNNRDLAGQILPWFTSLLNPITIRFNVTAAVDGQVGFGPVIATRLTNSVCAVESPTAFPRSGCDSVELNTVKNVKNVIFIIWILLGSSC